MVCVLGNYGGDRMSFAQACEDFEDEGGKTATVIVADDVASAPSAERAKRRGVAGMIFAFKTAGAAADGGASMDEVKRIAKHTADRTRSIGVALSPCLIPGAAAPGFSVEEGQMELGMGIHGEPGIERSAVATSDEVAEAMVERLLADREASGGRVAVLVNSLGATPLEELLILYRAADALLAKARIEIAHHYVGHYATSMEMAGASISILDLDAGNRGLAQGADGLPILAAMTTRRDRARDQAHLRRARYDPRRAQRRGSHHGRRRHRHDGRRRGNGVVCGAGERVRRAQAPCCSGSGARRVAQRDRALDR